ncbi:hypothetical protein [Pseudomonas asplenii]|uniref:hypothetical protein n=1 Tax=Pseudomonas asplenii TaxID=53407 RepID=UPI000361AA26
MPVQELPARLALQKYAGELVVVGFAMFRQGRRESDQVLVQGCGMTVGRRLLAVHDFPAVGEIVSRPFHATGRAVCQRQVAGAYVEDSRQVVPAPVVAGKGAFTEDAGGHEGRVDRMGRVEAGGFFDQFDQPVGMISIHRILFMGLVVPDDKCRWLYQDEQIGVYMHESVPVIGSSGWIDDGESRSSLSRVYLEVPSSA